MRFLERFTNPRTAVATMLLLLFLTIPFGIFSQTKPVIMGPQVRTVTFAYTAGAANITVISITPKDTNGNPIPNVPLNFWLSDSLAGTSITATSASGGIQVIGGTTIDGFLTTSTTVSSRVTLFLTSDNAGLARVQITDTAKTLFVPTVRIMGNSRFITGTKLAASNYGLILFSEITANLKHIFFDSKDVIFSGAPVRIGKGVN